MMLSAPSRLCAMIAAVFVGTIAPAHSQRQRAADYSATVGGTLIPPGRTVIDGRRMSCGSAPTVLDSQVRDYGESHPGFLVLNPNLVAGVSTPVKLWIYSHECAHQSVGRNEGRADCVAAQRGRREGWLSSAGLAQVCDLMRRSPGDSTHFAGSERCALLQQCYAPRSRTKK
jgi:hypothetical protein